jgi:hypothetical protein
LGQFFSASFSLGSYGSREVAMAGVRVVGLLYSRACLTDREMLCFRRMPKTKKRIKKQAYQTNLTKDLYREKNAANKMKTVL